jgi:hypothetical protein
LAEAIGRENGFHFTQEEVEASIQAARRDWITRWIN